MYFQIHILKIIPNLQQLLTLNLYIFPTSTSVGPQGNNEKIKYCKEKITALESRI